MWRFYSMIKQLLKDKIIEMLQTPKDYKVLIVDTAALDLLNSVCKMSDILSQNVIQVSTFLQTKDMDVIYLIAPTVKSVSSMLDDAKHQKSLYIYSISELSDMLFDKIKHSPVKPRIKCCKELNLQFTAPDSNCFSLDNFDAFYNTFNPPDPSLLTYELQSMAKQIASVMSVLGEYPLIRYHTKPTLFSSAGSKTLSSSLANLVQDELDSLCRSNQDYPPPSPYKRAVLIIVDRSIDVLAPLIHDQTYQAMAADLVGLYNGKYTYSLVT
jgi:syntaxin-binding protein 1